MRDQAKNALIGIFVLAAIGIITYILLFLHPTVGNEGQMLKVRFSDIDKVSKGTRVLFAGNPVGEVDEIHEVPEARLPENLHEGEVYAFELVLKVDSNLEVYTTDKVYVHTAGLLGEKSVLIEPLPPPPGMKLVRVTDQILYATPPLGVDDAIRSFKNLSEKAQIAVEKISEQLDVMKDQHIWENAGASVRNIREITTVLNKPKELEEIVHNFHASSASFYDVAGRTQRGEGSFGKLFVNDDFYLRLTSVMNKAETVMDDINHYGLLFQNDKNWQRVRARRVNLLSKLSSPEEFQNYFNDEVNQISTSLSRVSMVLQETVGDCCTPVICSPEFVKIFADLLRRVEGLENDIKLYNQQIVEKREKECCENIIFELPGVNEHGECPLFSY